MSRKLFITLIIIGILSMTSLQVFAQEKNSINSNKELWHSLKDNYTVNLTIEMPQIKKNISFVVASTNFEFAQYFPNAQINLEGNLELKNNNTYFLAIN